jgi:outer membrane protein TolC
VARTELLEVSTRDSAALTAERLASLLHAQPGARLALQEDLLAPLPPPAKLDVAALTQQALEQRSEGKALEARHSALEEQERVQRAGFLPRIDASGEVLYANPNQRFFPPPDAYKLTWQLGAQLSWGLTDALQAASGMRTAQANRAAVDAQRAALADTVRVEVFEAVQRVQSVEVQQGSAERGLAAAQEALRVRERLFEAGAGTATELLDAQNTLVGAQFAALEARVEQRRARRLLELSLSP